VVARREAVVATIAHSYESFGFRRIETPALEGIERLTSGQGGDNEKLIFKVLRRGLDDPLPAATEVSSIVDLGLRYDLTVPLTRYFSNYHVQLGTPFRALQIGAVWRAERPQRGRYRQFTQCDIDTIGEPSAVAESELLEATITALRALGIDSTSVRVNDRRLLSAIAAESGVESAATGRLFVVLDKLDKIGWDGVTNELVESGVPARVAERCRWLIDSMVAAPDASALVDQAADSLPGLEPAVLDGLTATAAALSSLEASGEGSAWRIDPTVVRGMGYYTGQIFEVAHPSSAGSIAGGGRYDGLVGRSLGRDVPAVGISIGFERVVDLATVEPADLGLAVLYGDEPIDQVLATARRIRSTGRPVALVARRGSMRTQLDALATAGYRAFATIEGGSVSDERSLTPAGAKGGEATSTPPD
jgi:histidyl-tRNA synthetase